MSHEIPRSKIEIDSSIGNLFDKSMFYTALWPVEAFIDTIEESGYRGLEWHPIRGIVAGLQMNNGLVSQHSKDRITSLHQSYRSEKRWKEAWEHPNRFNTMMSYVLLPETVSSLDDLERLQTVVGKELPIVLYPRSNGEESGIDRPFSEKIFQPTPEVMRDWKVRTPEELISEAYKRGYTGLCLDLFHMRAQEIEGTSLYHWQETLPRLLLHTQEIHIAAGRIDIKQNHINTEQELRDLLAGKGETDIIGMLKMIKESEWSGRIVTEIPAAALHMLRSERSSLSSVKYLIEDHSKIVHNIQDLLT